MKKKVFSLMMTLVLAFMGVARAEVVTIGDGLATSVYAPINTYYNYSLTEMLYTSDQIGTAGSISSISFNYALSTSKTFNVEVYMKNVSRTSFASYSDYETLASTDLVYSGTLSVSTPGWVTLTLDTPFEYDGTSNLLIAVDNNTGSYIGNTGSWYYTSSSNKVWYYQNDYTNPNPLSFSGSGSTGYYLPNIQLDITSGGGNAVNDHLHVKFMAGEEEVIDSLNLGVRPMGAWMEPFNFTMYSDGQTYNVTLLDFTPNDGMFIVEGEELPFQVANGADVDLTMGTNITMEGLIERQFVAITEGQRVAHIWPVVVEMYSPECPDVVEVALDVMAEMEENGGEFPFVDVPVNRLENYSPLHNDYTLPFPEIEEGMDAVYKLVFESDQIVSAEVTSGENGKVALYLQDGEELPHPMADNNYAGLLGGNAAAPFEAQIGEGTLTTGYCPFYTYYNYSLSTALYTAAEMEEAGATTAAMNSISFYATNAPGYAQQGISIWMANVEDTEVSTTSPLGSGMTLVYTGTCTPEIGWNEFAFNEGSFAWDGSSNVLILCQRLNGVYNSSVQWQAHNAGFNGMAYLYNDNNPYDAANTTYTMYRSTSRPNIIMTANGRTDSPMFPTEPQAGETEVSAGPVITNLGVRPGTYYLVASSTTEDFEVTINAEDMPCPQVEAEGFAFNPQPYDDEDDLEPASVTLRWQTPEYATGWRLVFGSTYYPEPNHPQTIIYPEDGSFSTEMANSYTVHNLWNNTNYFWHVEFNNSNCEEGVSSPIWGFTTHLNVPQNLRASDESIYEGETVTLTWNAVQDRTYRTYFIYQDGVKIGETQMNNINATSYPVSNLTYNMDGYSFYVTAIYDEGESAPSNTVIVKVSGLSAANGINGHVYEQDGETGIAGATVTVNGQDEFGTARTYTATTNAQGYYQMQVLAGTYTNALASCDGYQSVEPYINGPTFSVAHNGHHDDMNFIMDENFDGPCGVIAEYYPDSLDPESPYVKVYWGCGLPTGDIIEDFEDFENSDFEWQLDGSYPWTLTTQNPYEGQYCMKSGGAGVANLNASVMQVTVDVPRDGKMSFFGKISSEQNYDFGHFFIDNAEMATYSGAGNWGERKFDITAGEHTFKWTYTKDGSVNSNDDCFYVDYVNFCFQPEPAQPGWVYYDNGEYVDGIGTTSGAPFYWAVMFPAGSYSGNTVSKVSMYDGNGFNGQVQIYQGGTTAPQGSALYTQNVTTTGSGDFVEFNLTTPVSVDPAQNLWIVMYFQNGASSYVASACANTGDPNGRFVSLDGTSWDDIAALGLDYTWMLRAYVANGAKGEMLVAGNNANYTLASAKAVAPVRVKGEAPKTIFAASGNATTHNVGVPERSGNTRSLHHYNIYRTNCYNDGPYTAENTVLLASNWPLDTIYIDVEWADLEPGVYKWGVGYVYQGNRGELTESEINWGAPQAINRTAGELTADGPAASGNHAGNGSVENRDGWLVYDDGTALGGIGAGTTPFYWGVRFPAGSFTENTLTKVAAYDRAQMNGTLFIYNDGETAPANLLATTSINFTGSNSFVEVNFDQPIAVDPSKSLWVVLQNTSGSATWPAAYATYCGTDDSQWVSMDGASWDGLYNATNGQLDGTWMIRAYVENGSNGGNSGLNQLAEPRESETIWSNCLDKDMWLVNDSINNNAVDVTVLLNSADSPEGVEVSFTNYNEAEEEMYPMGSVTLDGTGYYVWESFRKGNYNVKVELEGYEPIEDSVSIWDATSLRYVMTEIIYGVNNLYVSRTGWAMWEAMGDPSNGQGGGNGGGGNGATTFTEGFEGGLNGWTVIDVNAGQGTWLHSDNNPGGYDYTTHAHGGTGFAMCYSFIDYVGSYNTDSYLVSPQKYSIVNGSHLTFWADNANDSYPESFSVCVATADNPSASDFTQVWSGNAKENGGQKAIVRHDGNRYDNWRSHNIDLSAYAGQDVYIAFHDVNYDMYEIWIDDVELTTSAKSADDRHLEYFKVMCTSIDGEPIFNANTVHPFCQVATDELVEGEHYICKVAAVYSTGMSDWAECEWQYESCENYAGTVNGVTIDGNVISWEYPNSGVTPPVPGQGSTFSESFEAGIPAGWATIDADGDGNNWVRASVLMQGYVITPHSGEDMMCSASWYQSQVLHPDNYLVSEQVTFGSNSTFTFWAAAQDASYPAEHFGVAISTGSQTNPADFTTIQEWTMTAKGEGKAAGITRSGRAMGNYYQYTVDLSAYAGQTGYIAVRHFNCSDNFYLDVDDFELTNGAKNRDGEWYYYDNGNNSDAIGLSYGTMNFNWGIMFPAGSYTSGNLTKVGYYDYTAHNGIIHIYQGGNSNVTPGNEIYSQAYTVNGTETYIEIAMTNNVAVDAAQDLWVVMESTTPGYTAAIDDSGSTNPNGALVSTDGASYSPIDVATGGNIVGNWNLRAYIESGNNPTPGDGNVIGAMIFADGEWEAFVPYPTAEYTYEGDAETVCVRMVYDGDAELPDNNYYYAMSCEECAEANPCEPVHNLTAEYMNLQGQEGIIVDWEDPEGAVSIAIYADGEYLGEAPAGQHPIFLSFEGGAPAGTYTIGAVAIHADCESDMVEVEVYYDDVLENNSEVALFPNPTSGNVTIQAEGMSHITVVNALGQVVYDADVNANEVVLNMAQFNAGMYMVRINTENGVVVKRVTVMQ